MDIPFSSSYILTERYVFLKYFEIFESVFEQEKVKSSSLSTVVTELKQWSVLSLYVQSLVMLCLQLLWELELELHRIAKYRLKATLVILN